MGKNSLSKAFQLKIFNFWESEVHLFVKKKKIVLHVFSTKLWIKPKKVIHIQIYKSKVIYKESKKREKKRVIIKEKQKHSDSSLFCKREGTVS